MTFIRNIVFGVVGGQIRFKPWAIRRVRRNWLLSSSGVESIWVLSLQIASSCAQTQYFKYRHRRPQLTPSYYAMLKAMYKRKRKKNYAGSEYQSPHK
jgi:hypothetical protein